jgi:hypothetical protein
VQTACTSKAAPPFDAELRLEDAGARRKDHVGGRRAEHDEVDVGGRAPRGLEGAATCVQREVRGELAVGGDVAFADAGASHDPVVARLDARLEVLVGEDLLGQVAAGPVIRA